MTKKTLIEQAIENAQDMKIYIYNPLGTVAKETARLIIDRIEKQDIGESWQSFKQECGLKEVTDK